MRELTGYLKSKALIVLIGLLSTLWISEAFWNVNLFPILHLKVIGAHSSELHQLVKETLSTMIKQNLGRIEMQKQLRQQWPSIQEATLWKIFPSTLIAHVQERKPMARFKSSLDNPESKQQWIDSTGVLFHTILNPPEKSLPCLIGLPEQSKQLLSYYRAIQTLLTPHRLHVDVLSLNEQGCCSVQLTNSLRIRLGHHHPVSQLQKLLDRSPHTLHKESTIAVVDLRYPNGMAITSHEQIL